MAGLLLKTNISKKNISPQAYAYMKDEIIFGLTLNEKPLRNTAGSCVTTLFGILPAEAGVTELLPPILKNLSSPDEPVVLGAFACLYKICEDFGDRLDQDTSLGRPLNSIIPSLLDYMAHPAAACREYALGCVNQFVLLQPAALTVNLERYIAALSALAQDGSSLVRARVCQAMSLLMEHNAEALLPRLPGVVEFMLAASADADAQVALDANEFWTTLADVQAETDYPIAEVLLPVLPRLVPLLLSNMRYSQDELEQLQETEAMMATSADRAQDIRSRHHKTRTQGSSAAGAEEEDDDDGAEEAESFWTLRKCSAAGLDKLAETFGPALLPVYLPAVQQLLQSSDWTVVESGLLSLGAVAEGCMEGMEPHLPQLFPFIMGHLQNPAYLIRSISCWTLSRYCGWAVAQHAGATDPASGAAPAQTPMLQLMEGLLLRINDGNKKVQEGACSAFATLEDEAGPALVPYLLPVLQHLMAALASYQAKNLLILYDAIGTLADAVGSALNTPQAVALLMPPLVAKYAALPDEDRELFPLFECLTSVAQALGLGFQEYAAPVWARCSRLVAAVLAAQQHTGAQTTSAAAAEAAAAEPDQEYMVCSLDLMSGVAEALGPGCHALVQQHGTVQLLFQCMQHPAPDVRQSAFALCGDLAKALPADAFVTQGLSHLMPLLLAALDPGFVSMSNNACWCIGELAVKAGAAMTPHVHQVLQRLLPILSAAETGPSLLENASITVGRLGLVVPDSLAPLLPELAGPWCRALLYVRVEQERQHAFQGLCAMIHRNPRGIQQDFVAFCEAVAHYEAPPRELQQQFAAVMAQFKAGLDAQQWVQFRDAAFPPQLLECLHQRYGFH